MGHKSKDAKQALEFDIEVKTKGFISSITIDGSLIVEHFQYKEIHQIIHHPDRGVEIIGYNDRHRVFYNDEPGQSQVLFDLINNMMISWMNSNLN